MLIGVLGLAACGGVARPALTSDALARPTLEADALLSDSAVVTWRKHIAPSLFSAPAVAGVLVVAATGDGQVIALSATSGERYWKHGLPGPLAGMVRAGTRLFAASGGRKGRAVGLRLRDGSEIWSRAIGAASHPPALAGDHVLIATDDGAIHALDARTGMELWRTALSGRPAAPPAVLGDEALVATRTDTLFHLALSTGAVVARTPLPSGVSAPTVPWAGLLLVPLQSGVLLAYDAAAHTQRWRADLGAPILAAPVVSRHGDAYILTRSTEVWRVTRESRRPRRLASLGGAATGSLALAGERLIVGRLDGELLVLRDDGSLVWSERLEDSLVAPAAAGDGAIYAPLQRGTIVRIEGAR